jgi:carboxyl-terminal processing protease
MRIKRIVFGLLILPMLACNFVTQMVYPPTATPLSTATSVPTATASPVPTPQLQPAYIPPECTTIPLATIPPDLAVQATPDVPIEEVSQTEQLSIFRELGDVVEAVYVYPDYNGKDWNEIEARYQARIEAGLDTQSFYTEMSLLIEELGDEHSFFLSPTQVAESQAELRGDIEFVGVGIYSQPDFERGRLIVVSTFPGSPADYGGIKDHDSILFVDGQPITEDFSDRIGGPQCSAVVLTVQSPGEAPREVMLVRYSIQGNIPIDARLVSTSDASKIGYIFIPTFFDETLPEQIENALNQFGPLDGLILDLRMNGGGISTVAYPIMEYFIQGRLGQFVSRASSRDLEIQANEVQNSQTVPLVVMVSQDTVSFGEIFAGVLQDAGRAQVVGETSLGNLEVMHGYDFEDGSQAWIADETFTSAFSDANWEETGIIPDVQAFAEWDTFYFENDPSIAAAVNLLGHQ